MQSMELDELLNFIKTQPSAYLGTRSSEQKYSALVGFISGYVTGVRYAHEDLSEEVFPQNFNSFVVARLNSKYGFSKYGAEDHWFDVILVETGNQDAAFQLFYELFEAYRQRTSA